MLCKNCGNPVEDGAKYCQACGSAIATSDVHTQMSGTPRKPDEGIIENFFKLHEIYQEIICVSGSGVPLFVLAFCRAR